MNSELIPNDIILVLVFRPEIDIPEPLSVAIRVDGPSERCLTPNQIDGIVYPKVRQYSREVGQGFLEAAESHEYLTAPRA